MLYRVLKPFKDMKDEEREYQFNDWYPRFNLKVEQKRLDELVKSGFIQEASTEEKEIFPKHTGGGWYELSNGERVQGKGEAQKKQKSLDK
ncbi:hypothetical protein [Allofustis seminis]|uniref:hypothetical protein n=1 Tax=Allofustis seminis TaxID=166939 RepID=UPI00036247E1|nr:hypothetical protein [Allofustis seminis]